MQLRSSAHVPHVSLLYVFIWTHFFKGAGLGRALVVTYFSRRSGWLGHINLIFVKVCPASVGFRGRSWSKCTEHNTSLHLMIWEVKWKENVGNRRIHIEPVQISGLTSHEYLFFLSRFSFMQMLSVIKDVENWSMSSI